MDAPSELQPLALVHSSPEQLKYQLLPYLQECRLLRASARLLRMPPRSIVASFTYLHLYKRHPAQSLQDVDPMKPAVLVAACLLLASKVEEVSAEQTTT